MAFIDTQSTPRRFTVTYDRGSLDYIVMNNYTKEAIRFDTIDMALDHIELENLRAVSRPASLPKPTYGFGANNFQNYSTSRKRDARQRSLDVEASTPITSNGYNSKLPRTRSRLYKEP